MIGLIIGTTICGYLIYISVKTKCKKNSQPVANIPIIPITGVIDQQTIYTVNEDDYSKFSIATSEMTNDNEICSICLEEIEMNQNIRVLNCFHKYHKNCIEEWLNISLICPQCNCEFKS